MRVDHIHRSIMRQLTLQSPLSAPTRCMLFDHIVRGVHSNFIRIQIIAFFLRMSLSDLFDGGSRPSTAGRHGIDAGIARFSLGCKPL